MKVLSKIEEAQNKKIFLVDMKNDSFNIIETDYYSHVMESEDITTTPRGVGGRHFVEEVETSFYNYFEEEGYEDETEEEYLNRKVSHEGIYFCDLAREAVIEDFEYSEQSGEFYLKYFVISSWGVRGNNYTSGKRNWSDCFSTKEETEDELFSRIEKYEFNEDYNRDTTYFESYEGAYDYGVQHLSELLYIDFDVAESYMKHWERWTQLLKEKQQKENAELSIQNKNNEAIAKEVFSKYGNIKPMNETFGETCNRLSKAIEGHEVAKNLFFKEVKRLRDSFKVSL